MIDILPAPRRAAASALASSRHGLAIALIASTLVAALAGCGGGDVRQTPARASPAPAALTAAPAATAGSATDGSEPSRRRPLALSNEALGDQRLSELLPYLEQNYGHLLGTDATTQRAGGYTYRCYTPTGNCVGNDNTALFGLGPAVGNLTQPVKLATLNDFCKSTPRACGTRLNRQLVIDGLTQDYIVYIPWAAVNRAVSPVVSMLHGTSGTGEDFYLHSGWREKADQEGLIAVFPTALRHCHFDDANNNGSMEAGGTFNRLTKAARPLSMVFVVGELDDHFTGPLGSPWPYATDVGTTPAWLNMVSSFLTITSLANTPYTWQPAVLFGDTMGVYRYSASTATPAGGNEFIAVVVKGLTHQYPAYMPTALWAWFSPLSLP